MNQNKPGYVGCRLRALADLLREATPDAKYATPEIHADGSIHYTPVEGVSPPPNINGYVRAKNNPWSFVPLWPECITRRLTIYHRASFSVFDISMTCNDPTCKRYKKNVNCYQCASCPNREDFSKQDTISIPGPQPAYRPFAVEKDGSILYTQEDGEWEPPRDIDGFKRDPENPWRFIPLVWPDCVGRHVEFFQRKSCGCLGTTITCNNEKSEYYKQKVTVDTCEKCPSITPMQIYQHPENP
jgi:hypothetical protein